MELIILPFLFSFSYSFELTIKRDSSYRKITPIIQNEKENVDFETCSIGFDKMIEQMKINKAEYTLKIGLLSQGRHYFKLRFSTISAFTWFAHQSCSTLACINMTKPDFGSKISEFNTIIPISLASKQLNAKYFDLNSNTESSYYSFIGLIEHVPDEFIGVNFAGEFGIGMLSKTIPSVRSLPAVLFKSLSDFEPVATLYLNRNLRSSKHGALYIGRILDQYYVGDMIFVPSESSSLWSIKITSLKVNNNKMDKELTAIIDSTISLITLPKLESEWVHRQLGALKMADTGYYKISCNTKALPNIGFMIGTTIFPLTADDYVRNIDNYNACITNFKTSNNDQNAARLGIPFLKRYFTAYDYQSGMIGIAESALMED